MGLYLYFAFVSFDRPSDDLITRESCGTKYPFEIKVSLILFEHLQPSTHLTMTKPQTSYSSKQPSSPKICPRSPPLRCSFRPRTAPPSPTTRSRKQKTGTESSPRSWDESDIVIGCEHHCNCLPVTRSEFITLVRCVHECALAMTEYLSGPGVNQFFKGVKEIFTEMMKGEFWRYNECRYCWIQKLITGDACGAWFLSLWVLKRRYAFYQSMHFLETLGHDTGEIQEWIEQVLPTVDSN